MRSPALPRQPVPRSARNRAGIEADRHAWTTAANAGRRTFDPLNRSRWPSEDSSGNLLSAPLDGLTPGLQPSWHVRRLQCRVVHYSGLSGFWQCGGRGGYPSRFAHGHAVRVVDHLEPHYSPEEIVRRVHSCLGESDYRLLSNNCEHFCNWCLIAVSRSDQVESRLMGLLRPLAPLSFDHQSL